jgi:three-Cys-motif partner protein
MNTGGIEPQHLKRVSRVKHYILTRYLPSWAVILGSAFDLLYYIDCFAGPGRYEAENELVDGSPIIAVRAGKEFAVKNSGKKLGIVLVDDNPVQLAQLKECLRTAEPYPENLAKDI